MEEVEVPALVASNVFFFVVIVRALQYRYYFTASLFFFVALVSALFHLCKGEGFSDAGTDSTCALGISFARFRYLDYVMARTVLIRGILLFGDFAGVQTANRRLSSSSFPHHQQHNGSRETFFEVTVVILFMLTVSLVNHLLGYGPLVSALLALVAFCVDIITWVIASNHCQRPSRTCRCSCAFTLRALVVSSIGIGLFLADIVLPERDYWITHSVWHAVASFAVYMALEARIRSTPPDEGKYEK